MTLYPDVVMVVTIILCGISNSWHTPKPCNLEEDIKKYIDKCNTAALFFPLGWDIERYYSILVLFKKKMATNALKKGEFECWIYNSGICNFSRTVFGACCCYLFPNVCWHKLNLFERMLFVITYILIFFHLF